MILMIHQRIWTRLELSLRALIVILCVFVVYDVFRDTEYIYYYYQSLAAIAQK